MYDTRVPWYPMTKILIVLIHGGRGGRGKTASIRTTQPKYFTLAVDAFKYLISVYCESQCSSRSLYQTFTMKN